MKRFVVVGVLIIGVNELRVDLNEIFTRQRAKSRFGCAARAYMVLLVGCTIFADKTFTLVEEKYLLLLWTFMDVW